MNRLAIIGASEFAKQVIEYAYIQGKYEVVGLFDDYFQNDYFQGHPILGQIKDVSTSYKENQFDVLFIAIGYNHLKFKFQLMNEYRLIPFATIIHPTAIIEKNVVIEEGTIIYGNAYIGLNSIIKQCSVINIGSIIPHDNQVGECSFLSLGINLGGRVQIGERSFIGLGVTVSDNISIGNDVIIGAGTLVIKNILESGTYVGSPSRKIK